MPFLLEPCSFVYVFDICYECFMTLISMNIMTSDIMCTVNTGSVVQRRVNMYALG